MGAHKRLQPGVFVSCQGHWARNRNRHRQCPSLAAGTSQLTRTCPSFYTLSHPKDTGIGFMKWTSSVAMPSDVKRRAPLCFRLPPFFLEPLDEPEPGRTTGDPAALRGVAPPCLVSVRGLPRARNEEVHLLTPSRVPP